MARIHFYNKKDKPQNYYRTSVTTDDFRLAMDGNGWLTITQICGLLGAKIPPTAAVRMTQLHAGGKMRPIDMSLLVASGRRDVVRTRMQNLIWRGKVEKHGSGKEAKYRWIDSENNSARQDQA
jgi:hypothetical protein